MSAVGAATPELVAAPALSVIIVNWNVRELLRACLDALAKTTATAHQTIVVDNASADGSVEMLRADFPEITLIASSDNLGFVAGCEAGYALATAPLVLLLNPDTEVHPGAIDRMVARFAENPRLGVLGGHLRNTDGSFQRAAGGYFPGLRNLAWNYLFLNRLLPRRWAPLPLYLETEPAGLDPIDWVSGAALMLRREAVGDPIFDPEIFMFGEDMALCHRIAESGWQVRIDAEARVTHHHGQSFRQANAHEVLASVYKGPRHFFRRNRSAAAALAYDAILFAGYAIRVPGYWLAARLRPGRGYDELARFACRYLGIMLRGAGRRG